MTEKEWIKEVDEKFVQIMNDLKWIKTIGGVIVCAILIPVLIPFITKSVVQFTASGLKIVWG